MSVTARLEGGLAQARMQQRRRAAAAGHRQQGGAARRTWRSPICTSSRYSRANTICGEGR